MSKNSVSIQIEMQVDTSVFDVVYQNGDSNRGGHSLIKVTGGPTLRLLPRAVQQLKLLPGVDTKSSLTEQQT